jgi:hypothetical protein
MLENKNGERSGGTRYNQSKPGMFWAIPMLGLRLVARVTMHGAKKYAPLDWAEGQSFSTLLDCASRHLLTMLTDGPWAKDAESGLYHAAHLGWNVLCLLHFMEQKRHDLDDVTQWQGVTTSVKEERDLQAVENATRAMDKLEGRTILRPPTTPWALGDIEFKPDTIHAPSGPKQWAGPDIDRHLAGSNVEMLLATANAILDDLEEIEQGRAQRDHERTVQQMEDTEAAAHIDPQTGEPLGEQPGLDSVYGRVRQHVDENILGREADLGRTETE